MSGPCVLVGANLGEHSDEAIRQADAWARAHHWELLVCHVAPATLGVHMLFPQRTEQEVLAGADATLRLDRMLREHVAKLTGREAAEVQTIIETGAPDDALIHCALQQRAVLVAIGSHSHSELRHIFLGDVAESLTRHAHCSVLVARPHAATRRVLIATDLSSDATFVIAFAAEHARRTGAQLHVACCIERRMELAREMTNFGAAYGFVRSEYEDTRRSVTKRLAAQLASVGAQGEIVVLDGAPAPSIVHAAAEIDAQLVMIGADAFGPRHILQTVPEKVARAAPCSVLLVRPLARTSTGKR